jgi:hypothetical protein
LRDELSIAQAEVSIARKRASQFEWELHNANVEIKSLNAELTRLSYLSWAPSEINRLMYLLRVLTKDPTVETDAQSSAAAMQDRYTTPYPIRSQF